MINKRKKKKDITDTFQNLKLTSGKRSVSLGGVRENVNSSTFNDVDSLRSSLNSKLGGTFDDQVENIQSQAEQRLAAEESNLDTFDRGSRYVRKNEKLKKFKV